MKKVFLIIWIIIIIIVAVYMATENAAAEENNNNNNNNNNGSGSETIDYNLSDEAYSLAGFGSDIENDLTLNVSEGDSNYITVGTELEFIQALDQARQGNINVIEITSDLDLGYNEVGSTVQSYSNFTAHSTPLTHPTLISTGVSRTHIKDTDSLLIYSKNGATLKHTNLTIDNSNNIKIRNLSFDELWEWDESTSGEFDKHDWDYITVIGQSSNVWIDHCTFSISYDGLVDIKEGSSNVSITWNTFNSVADGSNDFFNDQFIALEEDKTSYTHYNDLRTQGVTYEHMIQIFGTQRKGHLVGSEEFATGNEDLSLTLAYNTYYGLQERLPRLRAGNAHVYNVYIDASDAYNAKKLIEETYSYVSTSYKFSIVTDMFVSTEGGALLVENVHMIGVDTPVIDNQKVVYENGYCDSNDCSSYTGKYQINNVFYEYEDISVITSSGEADGIFDGNNDTTLEFSWNTTDGTLPYEYDLIPVNQIADILTGSNTTCGAGTLNWTADKWMQASYTA